MTPRHPLARREPPTRRLPGGAVLAFVFAGALACGGGGGREGGAPAGAPSATPVDVAEARVEPVSVRVASVGSLEAEKSVDLRSEVEATVERIPVAEGDRVAKGDTLVVLDTRELRAQVAAAQAAFERAKAQAANLHQRLERNRGLLAAGAISPQALDDIESSSQEAEAATQEAEANLRLARRKLDKAVVRAPFAGRVGTRGFYVGDLLRVGDRIMTLIDDDPLKVVFDLPEQYLGRVETGTPVSVEVRSLPSESFSGRVVFVSPQVDPETRSFQVKAEVPNRERDLTPGQFVDVEVELARHPNAVVVPEESIVPRGGENYVFRVTDGTAHLQKVALGQREPGKVEVTSGIAAGDRVVVAGQQKIEDGSKVEATLRTPESRGEGSGGEGAAQQGERASPEAAQAAGEGG